MRIVNRIVGRLALAAICGSLLVGALAPVASAQDEPALVFPCADGIEWAAEPGQPIEFGCGWGTVGGPGRMRTFLQAHSGTLVVLDEQGVPVLTIGPDEFRNLWAEPETSPSGFDDVTCAGPRGQGTSWSYLLEGGLPEGTYTVRLAEALRHPTNDGFHTCRFADGTRVVPPPSQSRGSWEAVGTLLVGT